MKALPPALQAHLSGGVTTLCYCWRVTRHDGTVMGFTEHDRDVTAAGTTFQAGSGFTASRIEQSLGLAVDNMARYRVLACRKPTSWRGATTTRRSTSTGSTGATPRPSC